jgi:hypothetical protein
MTRSRKKMIACILAFLYCVSLSQNGYAQSVYRVSVPLDMGTVVERFEARPTDDLSAEDPVIIIQDAHTSLEAQKNIARIIEKLKKDIPVSFVGVEAAVGRIVISDLRAFPERYIRSEVMREYLDNGAITGATFEAIVGESERDLVGLESFDLYLRHYTHYLKMRDEQKKSGYLLREAREHMLSEQAAISDDTLRDLLAIRRGFKHDPSHFFEYARALIERAIHSESLFDAYLMVPRFVEIARALAGIDRVKVEEEARDLCEVLPENYECVDSHYSRICSSAIRQGIAPAEYPHFFRYTTIHMSIESLDEALLLDELNSLYYDLIDALPLQQQEKKLFSVFRQLETIQSLTSLEATRHDIKHFAKIDISSTVKDILSFRSGTTQEERKLLTDYIDSARHYYMIAHKRDTALVENLIAYRARATYGAGSPLLVAGGYHSAGITGLLREKNIPYVVISPRVTSPDLTRPYTELMLGVNPLLGALARATLGDPNILNMPNIFSDQKDGIQLRDLHLKILLDFIDRTLKVDAKSGILYVQTLLERLGTSIDISRDEICAAVADPVSCDLLLRDLLTTDNILNFIRGLSHDEIQRVQRIRKRKYGEEGIDAIERVPLDMPLFFPNNTKSRGTHTPEWAELTVVSRELLKRIHLPERSITVERLLYFLPQAFKSYGLEYSDTKAIVLLNALRQRGLIENDVNFHFSLQNRRNKIFIAVPVQVFAVAANDAEYIKDELLASFEEGKESFWSFLEHYSAVTERWPKYQVEMQQRVLRPFALLERHQHELVRAWLAAYDATHPKRPRLIDAVSLMFDFERIQGDWLKTQTSYLQGRRIYYTASEVHLLKGGLGRVMLYHGKGMKDLGADLVFIEPDWPLQRMKDRSVTEIDYGALNIKLNDLQRIDRVFETRVGHDMVSFTLRVGIDDFGIPTFLIRDIQGKYINILYEYGTAESPISEKEYSEFITKATREVIRYLEEKRKDELGAAYKSPIGFQNDGQCLSAAAWQRIFYEYSSTPELQSWNEIAKTALFAGTTHTYRNRVILGFEDGLTFLRNAGVSDDWLWLFLRREIDGSLIWDLTSGGLRALDVANGVAAIHVFEMNARDPRVRLRGITNADQRALTAKYFIEAMVDMGISADDYEYLSGKQIQEIKKECKNRMGLDPNKFTVAYSGRLVDEKADFSDDFIEKLVKDGMQFILYGNVQASNESHALKARFEALASRLGEKGYSGRFIFNPQFDLQEQLRLIAAADLFILPSTRYTGAAESTEVDGPATGALMMGPPYWEGFIQAMGLIVDWKKGTGNVLVPAANTWDAYYEAVQKAFKKYNLGTLGSHMEESLRVSRVYESSLTSAAYLYHLDEGLDKKLNGFLPSPKPRICGEVQISNVAMQYAERDSPPIVPQKRRVYDRYVHFFNVPEERSQVGRLELTVDVDLNVRSIINPGRTDVLLPDLVEASFVNDAGLLIPLTLVDDAEKARQGIAVFSVTIPEYFPLPTSGELVISSGIWQEVATIEIAGKPEDIRYSQEEKSVPLIERVSSDILERRSIEDQRAAQNIDKNYESLLGHVYYDQFRRILNDIVSLRDGEQYFVIMQEEQVRRVLASKSPQAALFINELKRYLSFDALSSKNRLVIKLDGPDFMEHKSELRKLFVSHGLPATIADLFITYEPARDLQQVVTTLIRHKQREGTLRDLRQITAFVDPDDRISEAINTIAFDARIPAILTLGFHVSRTVPSESPLLMSLGSLRELAPLHYAVAASVLEKVTEFAATRQFKMSA